MKNEIIELDIDDTDAYRILDIHIKESMSTASYEVFENNTIDDVSDLYAAAGKALFNEVIVNILKDKIKNEK